MSFVCRKQNVCDFDLKSKHKVKKISYFIYIKGQDIENF